MNRKEQAILVTLVMDLLLVGIKFWLASASGSLSLQAGAWHTVGDLFVGLFVLLGLWLARSKNAQRRIGVAVVENLIAVVVGLVMLYAGWDIFNEVMQGGEVELRNVGPVTLAALLTVAVAWFASRYKLYVGEQTQSPALIASGYHARIDMYASIVVVVGLAGSGLLLPNLDRVAAVVIVLFIAFTSYEILRDALSALRARRALEVDEHAAHEQVVRRRFVPLALGALLVLYLLSGFYIVPPDQVAVVLRFGQVVNAGASPGLHYRLPWPVQRVELINPSAVRRSQTPVALMMTGDQTLVSVSLGVHYVIDDAAAYLFAMSRPDAVVAQAAEAAVRQAVAERSVDALLTTDRAAIQRRTLQLLQETLQGYRAGLRAVSVQLVESRPPQEVAAAFRDVASAREDKNTFVNEALAYRNEVIPTARGEAARLLRQAQAYGTEKLGRANGEAERFASRQGAYAKAPEVTRLRLYLEAAEEALRSKRKFLIDPRVKLGSTDLWLGGNVMQTFPPNSGQ